MTVASDSTVIVGAGPAGMGCAYTLAQARRPLLIIEQDDVPGGLCQTMNFCGYLFDIGGHRFLSKSKEINQFWHEIMAGDMLSVNRQSRIFFRHKYFNYPLSFFNVMFNLGLWEASRCVASYFFYKYFKHEKDDTFAGWVTNRFGKRLFDIFFKTYTEKVWAVPCEDISADWAAQRIRGLSLRVALKSALGLNRNGAPKTLSDRFLYPRTGPGEFYERLENKTTALGARFEYRKRITQIRHDGGKIRSVNISGVLDKKEEEIALETLCLSMPLPLVIRYMDPKPPDFVVEAAKKLVFRDFMVVNIILDKEHIFPDQWLYIHSPEVRVGRIQNYKNWSPAMVPDLKKTSLGLEYFCNKGDDLWTMNDADLINFAVGEIDKLGIVSRRHLINGFVVRRQNAYPVYSMDYQNNIQIIKEYLKGFSNLYPMGRSGLFRYNNSDHALLTGIYTARNIMGETSCDVWAINPDEDP